MSAEDVERLSRELAETTQEKIQAAEYGLAVLEDKQRLKQQYDELDAEYESVRRELEQLREVNNTATRSHSSICSMVGETVDGVWRMKTPSRG